MTGNGGGRSLASLHLGEAPAPGWRRSARGVPADHRGQRHGRCREQGRSDGLRRHLLAGGTYPCIGGHRPASVPRR
jgi:hypothetical protein